MAVTLRPVAFLSGKAGRKSSGRPSHCVHGLVWVTQELLSKL